MTTATLAPNPTAVTRPGAIYLKTETLRRWRSKRTLFFAIGLPALFFLLFSANNKDHLDGISFSAYYMVSMATYGAMNALFSTGGLISLERSTGWNRQLRLTALTGRQYVLTKVAVGYIAAVGSVVVVMVLATTLRHVDIGFLKILGIAVSVLLTLMPVAALGILVGYLAKPEVVQPLLGIGSSMLALIGGLWAPVDTGAAWIRDLLQALPVYWSGRAGREALAGSWVGWHGVAVVIAWTVVLAALAARAYQRDGKRV